MPITFKSPTQKKRSRHFRFWMMTASLLTYFSFESVYAIGKPVYDFKGVFQLEQMTTLANKSLTQFKKIQGDLAQVNNLLEDGLPAEFMSRLRQADDSGQRFTSTLRALNQGPEASLRKINHESVHRGGTDHSKYLSAQRHFKERFFPESRQIKSVSEMSQVKQRVNDAAETSTINSLALASEQKQSLKCDHERLTEISQQADQKSSAAYQLNLQTRLLERLCYQMEKLVVLQAQMLELQATTQDQLQPTFFKNKPALDDKGQGERP